LLLLHKVGAMATGKASLVNRIELRRLAEAKLKGFPLKHLQSLAEAQGLYHELEVHKVELEIQIDELCSARDASGQLLEKYIELYEHAPVGYFNLSPTGHIININLTGSTIFGIERSHLNGKHLSNFICRTNRPAFDVFLKQMFTTLYNVSFETTLQNKAEFPTYVQFSALPMPSGQERLITLTDITKHKRAEAALEKVEQAADAASRILGAEGIAAYLKLTETMKLAQQLESEPIALLSLQWDEAAKVATNRVERAAALAHQTVEDAANQAHQEVEQAALYCGVDGSEAGATASVRLAAKLARKKLETSAEVARQKVKTTTESMFLAMKHAAEMESQVKLAEERLQHEQLLFHTQRLESLGVLAGGIAHDFNNALTSILGNISLALMSLTETHQSFKPLGAAEKAGRRAAELAARLLTFAKGGAPVKKIMSLTQIIEESVSLAPYWAKLECVVHAAADLHLIEADESQMSQVFSNIIINAAQAMPDGGKLAIVAENIMIGPENALSLPPGSYVRITFADEGCGISEDNLNRIFDPYFTTKHGGTGLGLASVHSIVTKHGGSIIAESAVGAGTVFTCHLPSATGEFAAPTCVAPGLSMGHILVMDDDVLILNLATQLLQHLGYDVTCCTNGDDALVLYESAMKSGAPFMAAILDLTIPVGMGGQQVAQRIKAIYPSSQLIVSSGYSSDAVMADFANYGFSAALPKPYRVSELSQALAQLRF
jgi:PAS domain S-box-containing protein